MREKARPKEKEKVSEEPAETDTQVEEVVTEPNIEETEKSHKPNVTVEHSTIEVTEAQTDIEMQHDDAVTQVATTIADIFLPTWGSPDESEWMYGMPSRKEDQVLWAGEWADFLLQWTERNSIHIISVATFISEPPFKYLREKVDSFKMIAQVLIDKEIAEWVDRRKRQLRVYWKPLEDWADLIYEWALKTGKLRLDVKSIVIQESSEGFAQLPEKDLYVVLALMVEKELAEWIDKKKGAILVSA